MRCGENTESKAAGHKGKQRHDILGWLHASRGLLEETSGVHVWFSLDRQKVWVFVQQKALLVDISEYESIKE